MGCIVICDGKGLDGMMPSAGEKGSCGECTEGKPLNDKCKKIEVTSQLNSEKGQTCFLHNLVPVKLKFPVLILPPIN